MGWERKLSWLHTGTQGLKDTLRSENRLTHKVPSKFEDIMVKTKNTMI